MKPHLPITLLFALLGTFTARAVEIPDDYEQIDLWAPSYLNDYTSNTEEDNYAFILWTDVDFTPTSNPTWTSSTPLVTGGNHIFTTAEGESPVALGFSGGQSSVFKTSSLVFDNLSNLTFSNQVGSKGGGAIDLGVNGNLIISNVDDGIDNPNKADILFLGNKITSSYGGAIYNGQNVKIEDCGNIKFHGNTVGSDVEATKYTSGTYVSSGGAINTGTVQFISNKIVEFSENKVLRNIVHADNRTSTHTNTIGGALHLSQSSFFYDNAQVIFNGNVADSKSTFLSKACGGAIHTTAELNFNSNISVKFENHCHPTGA